MMTSTTSSDGPQNLDAVHARLYDAFATSVAVRHVARAKLRRVALDIAIVAFKIRSGYLFDAFALRDRRANLKDFFAQFLSSCREVVPALREVSILYDPISGQLFFVSQSRLAAYVNADDAGFPRSLSTWVSFIEIQGSRVQICAPPRGLFTIIRDVLSAIDAGGTHPVLISLPEDDGTRTIGDMVAFAACILQFPVAYVPTSGLSGGDALLSGVPLDVYECILVHLGTKALSQNPVHGHVMLKFSCPQPIGHGVQELAAGRLVERLRERFDDQVQKFATSYRLLVRHHVETLDRVAL